MDHRAAQVDASPRASGWCSQRTRIVTAPLAVLARARTPLILSPGRQHARAPAYRVIAWLLPAATRPASLPGFILLAATRSCIVTVTELIACCHAPARHRLAVIASLFAATRLKCAYFLPASSWRCTGCGSGGLWWRQGGLRHGDGDGVRPCAAPILAGVAHGQLDRRAKG